MEQEHFGGFTLKKSEPAEEDDVRQRIEYWFFGSAVVFVSCSDHLVFPSSLTLCKQGRPKTKREVMEELIAKSKYYKHQRQMENEERTDMIEQLDAEYRELLPLLSGMKRRDRGDREEIRPDMADDDDFEALARNLATMPRAMYESLRVMDLIVIVFLSDVFSSCDSVLRVALYRAVVVVVSAHIVVQGNQPPENVRGTGKRRKGSLGALGGTIAFISYSFFTSTVTTRFEF